MKKEAIAALKELLVQPKKIAIIPHRSPDGDAMGSTLAMYHFLLKWGHIPTVISPNDFPSFLAWMPGSNKVMVFENNKLECTEILQNAELIFVLDFNALHRTGEMEQVLSKLTVPFAMIDHHQAPDDFATFMYSETSIGSTCEMIYNFIEFLDKKEWIDTTIATCLYTGITTDSGSFRFPSTTSRTHRIVADLIDRGINNSNIHRELFDNNSFQSLQLLGRALQNMKVFTEYKIAFTHLSQKELDLFEYQKGDTEGIVNYGLSIKGVHLAVIFIEHKDENIIKISFRSQGSFDVNQLARNHFHGGGHINAAGGKSYESLNKTIKKFELLMPTLNIQL